MLTNRMIHSQPSLASDFRLTYQERHVIKALLY